MKMKRLFFATLLLLSISVDSFSQNYNGYVIIKTFDNDGCTYHFSIMNRTADHIKAKYFAHTQNGVLVPQRYDEWQKTKNVVAYASGAYMTSSGIPEGLTIDNGIMVNNSLVYNKMDGLIIVYATGGIVATDLRDGDLTLDGNSRKYNLRGSAIDLSDFITWSRNNQATVFQTHLLAYRNKFMVATNAASLSAERRILVVGHDLSNNVVHIIVNIPSKSTIYNSAANVYNIIIQRNMLKDIVFMINLDTGMRDIARCNNGLGNYYTDFEGKVSLNQAINLIAYYYE